MDSLKVNKYYQNLLSIPWSFLCWDVTNILYLKSICITQQYKLCLQHQIIFCLLNNNLFFQIIKCLLGSFVVYSLHENVCNRKSIEKRLKETFMGMQWERRLNTPFGFEKVIDTVGKQRKLKYLVIAYTNVPKCNAG